MFDMRRLAGILLFCALLLRGLIPAGYMPNVDAGNGQGFLQICYGNPASASAVRDDEGAPADTHQQGLCAFAMVGGALPVLILAVLLLVWSPPRLIRFTSDTLCLAAYRWSCAPPGARAPPVFA